MALRSCSDTPSPRADALELINCGLVTVVAGGLPWGAGDVLDESANGFLLLSTTGVGGGTDAVAVVLVPGEGECTGVAHLLKTDGASFIHNQKLQKEIFGPASMVIECEDEEQFLLAARYLSGNLTATLQATDEDLEQFKSLIKVLERRCI